MSDVARNAGLFALSLLCVQGAVYLLQLLSAADLSVAGYADVRLMESYAALGAMLISFGLPSAVLVAVSATGSETQRRFVVVATLLGGAVVAGALSLALGIGGLLVGSAIEVSHPGAVWTLAVLMSARLILFAVVQARQNFRYLAGVTLVACSGSLLSYGIISTRADSSIESWLFARGLLEAVVCIGLGMREVRARRAGGDGLFPARYREILKIVPQILSAAAPLGASLALRSLADHGPLLGLSAVGASAATISTFGLIFTLGMVALTPASVLAGVLVPQMARHAAMELGHKPLHAFSLPVVLAFTTSLAMCSMLIVVPSLLSWQWFATLSVLLAASGIVGFKAVAGLLGSYLLANGRGTAILRLNATIVVIAMLAGCGFVLGKTIPPDLEEVLWAVLLVEAVAAGLYVTVAARQFAGTPRAQHTAAETIRLHVLRPTTPRAGQ